VLFWLLLLPPPLWSSVFGGGAGSEGIVVVVVVFFDFQPLLLRMYVPMYGKRGWVTFGGFVGEVDCVWGAVEVGMGEAARSGAEMIYIGGVFCLIGGFAQLTDIRQG
jgi:hypothetical protein